MKRCGQIVILSITLGFTLSSAMFSGNVAFWDGAPAEEINIMALGTLSPLPIRTTTDSHGYYSIPIVLLPGIGDSFYIFCTAPSGYFPSPEYHRRYISGTDTIPNLDFELRPEGLPTFNIIVWVVDTGGNPFRRGEVFCQRNEAGAPLMVDSTDYGGRVVFSVYREAEYIINVSSAGYLCFPPAETVFVGVSIPRVELTFTMIESVWISPYWIHIFARDSIEQPVESLFVEWVREGSTAWEPVWTNSEGFAELHLDTSGIFQLRAAFFGPGIVVPQITSVELDSLNPVDSVFFSLLPDTTAIAEFHPSRISLNISPNPFNSAVHITLAGAASSSEAEIIDISGRSVAKLELQPNSVCLWQPDASLQTGLYFLSVRNGNNSYKTKLLFVK